MSLRFFSLFFVEMGGLGPAQISFVGVLSPIVIALLSHASRRLEKAGFGRLQINIQSRVLDILLLLVMTQLPVTQYWLAVLVVVHLLRMGVANCSRPLLRAVRLRCSLLLHGTLGTTPRLTFHPTYAYAPCNADPDGQCAEEAPGSLERRGFDSSVRLEWLGGVRRIPRGEGGL